MDPIQQLDAAIAQHLAAIQRTAMSAPPGGGPEWDALLRHYGLAPLPSDERLAIVQTMRMTRGATAAEVRIALAGLQAWARGELGRLRAGGSAALAHVETRIAGLVDQETAAYERALGIAPPPAAPPPAAPAVPGLAAIFANAEETSKEVPWAGMTYKSVGAVTCIHCGAPQEQQASFVCSYCRRPLAGITRPTT